MTLPAIDLRNIRAHKGSQDKAFEELCCQLASLEARPSDAIFHRKGPGADAGVECFLTFSNKHETAWQAKFYKQMDANLISSLDDSLGTALSKHPNLTSYIVCIPFNLSDARTGKEKTPRERWNDWKEKWEKKATESGRTLSILLWDETTILERLGRNNPLYSGRALYWFDIENLTPEWFQKQCSRSFSDLGQRYTPETNVELPIRRTISGFLRGSFLNQELEDFINRFITCSSRTINAVLDLEKIVGNSRLPLNDLRAKADLLLKLLKQAPSSAVEPFFIDSYKEVSREVGALVREILDWVDDQHLKKDDKHIDKKKSAHNNCWEFLSALDDFLDLLEKDYWQLVNKKNLLVYGDGGRGKSHLLADCVAHHFSKEFPVIFLMGSKFSDAEIWGQILSELDLPKHYQAKTFLGALDAAAQANNTKALIVIDALNERNGVHIWKDRLSGFLEFLSEFPYISTLLSCRTTYLDTVIPDGIGNEILPRIKHVGFSHSDAKHYLQQRSIVLPGSPNLMPEFTNPLFLKVCCDALEKDHQISFPRGLQGLDAVFEFYNQAVVKSVNERLHLDPKRQYVEKALDLLLEKISDTAHEYIPYEEAAALTDSILSSQGNKDKDILFQLESEGALSVEIVKQNKKQMHFVRFTFQRFSDYASAKKLLNGHLDKSSPSESFAEGTPLYNFLFDEKRYDRLGILEAIATILPETVATEILDILPDEKRSDHYIQKAFKESLLLRDPKRFTQRTMDLIEQHGGDRLILETSISIATEPQNSFNANWLSARLKSISMAERDSIWSGYLAKNASNDGHPLDVMISWTRECGQDEIDPDRAALAAILLTWTFSTSNRHVRDNATKSLVILLARRLHLAKNLLDHFKEVDDLYVLERLFGALYGACLQGHINKENLSDLADEIYSIVFSQDNRYTHALLRDYARGIIEYAFSRKALSSKVNIKRARPPYNSPWPIEHVPDELIATYKQKFKSGVYTDEIVGSTINDGDFARYVIDYEVHNWSSAPINTFPLPTRKQSYDEWYKDFSSWATPEIKEAYSHVEQATEAVSGQGPYSETPERELQKQAFSAFRKLIGDALWEDFRVRGMQGKPPGQYWGGNTSKFDNRWARRWVCKRAHDLGWNEELHGEFDTSRYISHDRTNHGVERIGKKYQWIALNELRARMADNLAYDPSYSNEDKSIFQGEWQAGLRDIDPSLLLHAPTADSWKEWREQKWWMPNIPRMSPILPKERLSWLHNTSLNKIDGAPCILLHNPSDKRDWLNLGSFISFRQHSMVDGDREMERETWARVRCVVVRKADEDKAIKGFSGKIITDASGLPQLEGYSRSGYLGEYPWHPAYSEMQDWIEVDEYKRAHAPVRATVFDYSCSKGGYDYSIEDTISISLPAPWIIHAMRLRQKNGKSVSYVDENDVVQFFDPAVLDVGPHAALISKIPFLEMLEKEGLTAIWLIAGEKGVFGGRGSFGGRYLFTSLYKIVNGDVVNLSHVEDWQYPSKDQLKRLLGEDPPPAYKTRE